MEQGITRSQAKAAGLKRYYTGVPCGRGHIAERQASKGECIECVRLGTRLRRKGKSRAAEAKRTRLNNPAKYRARYEKQNWKKLGVTPSRPRPEKCEADCGRAPEKYRLHLDHDHRLKKFRGWLCGRCNRAIGYGGDDPVILEKLAAYLRRTT